MVSPAPPGAGSPSTPLPAVELRGVGKRFDIYRSERGRLYEFFGNRKHHVEFWALRDVSLTVPRGQTFGVVGANGAGKSTLLRLLSGVSEPTEGDLIVRARRPGLLDLDLGFHPEFNGRENIAMTAAILGVSDEALAEITPKVVEFAELEDFIEFPVRTYSAGMQLRLGFAMAAHLDYDVIFIDEVLAVGDQYFQRKCIRKIEEFVAEGRTLVLVSHDLHSIRSLCSQVAWLHAGRIVAAGDAQDVINAYVDVARDREGRIKARIFGGAESPHARAMVRRVAGEAERTRTEEERGRGGERTSTPAPSGPRYFCTSADPALRAAVLSALSDADPGQAWSGDQPVADYEETHGERPVITGTGEVHIERVLVLDAAGQPRGEFSTGEAVTIATSFTTRVPVERPILGIAIFRNDDLYVFGPNTRFDGVQAMEGTFHGAYTFFLHYPKLPLLDGVYRISVALYDKNHVRPHVWHNQLYEFRMRSGTENHGIVDLDRAWGLVRHRSGSAESLP